MSTMLRHRRSMSCISNPMQFLIFEKLKQLTDDFELATAHHYADDYTFGIELTLSDPDVFRTFSQQQLAVLKTRLLPFAVTAHLPFYGLNIACSDRNIADYSFRTILEAIDFSSALGITTAVCHTTTPALSPQVSMKRWLKGFIPQFKAITAYAKKSALTICWENTYERDFSIFEAMLAAEPDTLFCLDTGHAHCFARFSAVEFLNAFGSKVRHMHLHDNNGDEDSHLPIGRGSIDFASLMQHPAVNGIVYAVFELDQKDFLSCTEEVKKLRLML